MSSDMLPVRWFCDVDGVIATTGRQPGRRYETYQTGGIVGGPANVDLDVVDAMRALLRSGLVDFRWCSNWEYEAPLLLAPVLGFPDFPLADPPSTQVGSWKTATVRDHAATGRPFVWTDDEIDKIEGQGVADLRASGLVISTPSRVGLTLDDVWRIEAYVRSHTR